MTPKVAPTVRSTGWVEWLFVVAIVASIFFSVRFLFAAGYLPQPYYYGSQSFFTDWTATAFFANNVGTYTEGIFNSVYPPLSFVFLRIFSVHSCYAMIDIFTTRECDWLGPVTMATFYVGTFPLVFRAFTMFDRRTRWQRTTAVMLGLPMLYAIERGNLIVPCFTFFVIGQGRVTRSAWGRWLGIAFAINFKPYLVLTVAGNLVNRRWRWLEGAGVATIFVYLVTYGLEGAGTPAEVLSGILGFATSDPRGIFERSFYASSYIPVLDLFKSTFPVMNFIGSRPIEWGEILLPAAMNMAKWSVVLVFGLAFLKPHVVPVNRLGALALALTLVLQDPGGYAFLYFVFLVFQERWRGPVSGSLLVIAYLLSLPADLQIAHITRQIINSFLTNRVVGYEMGINIGQILRPGLIIIEVFLLVGLSLGDLFRDLIVTRWERVSAEPA